MRASDRGPDAPLLPCSHFHRRIAIRRYACLTILALAVLAAGCASVSQPDGWAPPEAAGDVVYVSLDGGEISALDAESFAEIWTFPESEDFGCGAEDPETRDLEAIYGAPAFDEERLYVGAYDGNVYGVTREAGACEWRFETDDPIVGAPVLGEAGLYAASTDGNLYLLDPETGQEVNRFAAGEIWSTPRLAPKDGAIYVSTMEGKLWKLDAESLTPVWDEPFDTSAGLLTDPALAGDATVVVGGIGEKLYGIDTETGEERWSVAGGNWFWGTPASLGTVVYATTLDGEVIAVEAERGERLWIRETEEPVRAGPVLAGDLLVAVDKGGRVYRYTADSEGAQMGEPIRLDKTVYATPLALEDEVLIVSTGGDVYSITTADGRTTKVVD